MCIRDSLQGGVDRAGAGPETAALLDGADNLVAMAGAFGEDLEDEELDVAAPCPAAPAAHPAAESVPKAVPEVAMALVVVPGVFKKLFYHVAIVKDISLSLIHIFADGATLDDAVVANELEAAR